MTENIDRTMEKIAEIDCAIRQIEVNIKKHEAAKRELEEMREPLQEHADIMRSVFF